MTLYEWIALFERKRLLVVGLISLALMSAWGYFLKQPDLYRSSFTLTVTRTALPRPTEYSYDHFYRFQADERLAESVVAYLGSASGKQRVAERAEVDPVSFRAFVQSKLRIARQGTNLMMVETPAVTRESAGRLSQALLTEAEGYLARLNEDARDPYWFTVVSDEPVIHSARFSLVRLTAIGGVIGILAAFWMVVGLHFWEGYRGYRQTNTKKAYGTNT